MLRVLKQCAYITLGAIVFFTVVAWMYSSATN